MRRRFWAALFRAWSWLWDWGPYSSDAAMNRLKALVEWRRRPDRIPPPPMPQPPFFGVIVRVSKWLFRKAIEARVSERR